MADLCLWYQAADANAYSCTRIGNTPISTRRSATSHSHWLRRFNLTCLCCHDNSKATPCFFFFFFFLHPTTPPPPTAGATMQGCLTWAVEHRACEQPHLWSAPARQIGGLRARCSSLLLVLDSVGRQNHLRSACWIPNDGVYEQRVKRVENRHLWGWWGGRCFSHRWTVFM